MATKTIAPRLFSGAPRVRNAHGLPMEIKAGLRAIARHEKKSVSWVLEQVVIKYFKFREPRYVRAPGDPIKRRRAT